MIPKADISNRKLKNKCEIINFHINYLFGYDQGEDLSKDEGIMPFKGKIKNKVYNREEFDKWGLKFYYIIINSICA